LFDDVRVVALSQTGRRPQFTKDKHSPLQGYVTSGESACGRK
jgi:hypothetical protein